jgi:hypothetical protein
MPLRASPRRRSLRPSPYHGAVSMKLIPSRTRERSDLSAWHEAPHTPIEHNHAMWQRKMNLIREGSR